MRLVLCGILCFAQFVFAAASVPQKIDHRSPEKIGVRALEKVNWDWRPDLGRWSIKFRPRRVGYLSLIELPNGPITVWVRPGYSSERTATAIVHELAHAFDWDYLNPNLRKAWLAARNLPTSTLWYPPNAARDDYSSGAGDFAECVSWTLQGPAADKFRSRLGPPPNEAQQKLIWDWLTTLPKIKAAGK